jgi:hypothetical protein
MARTLELAASTWSGSRPIRGASRVPAKTLIQAAVSADAATLLSLVRGSRRPLRGGTLAGSVRNQGD